MLPTYLEVQGKQVHIPYYLWKMAKFVINLPTRPYFQKAMRNNTVPNGVDLPKKVNKVNFVINGHINNYNSLCHELIDLGYACDQTNIDMVIAYLTSHYLDIGLQPIECMLMTLSRLSGTFSITMQFSGEADLLLIANRNSHICIRPDAKQIHISEHDVNREAFQLNGQLYFLLVAQQIEIQAISEYCACTEIES